MYRFKTNSFSGKCTLLANGFRELSFTSEFNGKRSSPCRRDKNGRKSEIKYHRTRVERTLVFFFFCVCFDVHLMPKPRQPQNAKERTRRYFLLGRIYFTPPPFQFSERDLKLSGIDERKGTNSTLTLRSETELLPTYFTGTSGIEEILYVHVENSIFNDVQCINVI